MVSHDIEFVENVAESIIGMETPGIRKYLGSYSYYLEKSAAQNSENTAQQEPQETPDQRKERRRERARRRQELQNDKKHYEKKVAALEAKIEKNDTESKLILEQLSSGDNVDYPALNRRLHELHVDLELLTEQWEDAATKMEDIIRLNNEIHND